MSKKSTASGKAGGKVKTLHIFKPGKHTPMQGGRLTFSEADLAACARAYDPDIHEAPIVIGHPETNGPAHGWVGALIADKTGLRAVPRQVDPAFAEMSNAGRFKKVSASFYMPDSPQNPVPGSLYLRHVGFLGAQVPAVKGLEQVTFSEGETGVVTFEENLDADGNVSGTGLFAQLRAWLIKNKGQEVADDVLPEDKIEATPEVSDAIEDTEVKPDTAAEDVVAELAQQITEQAETIAQLVEEKDKLEEKLEKRRNLPSAWCKRDVCCRATGLLWWRLWKWPLDGCHAAAKPVWWSLAKAKRCGLCCQRLKRFWRACRRRRRFLKLPPRAVRPPASRM